MFVDQAILANLIGIVDSATPEGTEGRIQIPPLLQPIIQLQRPLNRVIDQNAVQHLSVIRETGDAQSGVDAGATVVIFRLGAGFWTVLMIHSYFTDFTIAANSSSASRVNMRLQDDTNVVISNMFANATQVHARQTFPLAIRLRPGDTNPYVEFSLFTGNTLVAQNARSDVTLMAHKLL